MLDLRVEIKNGKVVLDGLQKLAGEFPGAVRRGLKRAARGIYAEAFKWLSGGARSQVRLRDTDKYKKSRLRGQSDLLTARPGGYPVPRITGHLREYLAWLDPGESKSGDLGTFTAGPNEVVIFDAASYAPAVFLGLGSSEPHGPRDALKDALMLFDHGGNIQRVIGEEIQKEINKSR